MKAKCYLFYLLVICSITAIAQPSDKEIIRQLYDNALTEGQSYEMLEYLTTKIGARLSGSPQAAAAVEWSRQVMQQYGFDSVWLQPVMVPHWVRGQKEIGRIVNSKKAGSLDLSICALGNSVGTGPAGVMGNVIEVKNFDELKLLGEKKIKGKIIFFNRPMDKTKLHTFMAYSGAVDQRGAGASEAARYGAVGVIVRSMGLNLEDYPHTGALTYQLGIPKIPAVAISTKHAELLSTLLKDDATVQVYFETHCEMLADAPSFNVIGELRGTVFPDEIITVGGHLDSWDLGQGAHDDGAGCVQSIEVLRLFKTIGYKPKRTIRAVMFMNEENGLRGGREYAQQAEFKKEKHLAALESDRGGFTPRGFTLTAPEAVKEKIRSWKPLLEDYGVVDFSQSGGGADINALASQGVVLLGYLPDSQRYFSYHHTPEDTFDKVDKRELELGAASMAAIIYLIDKHGLH
jgi:carboxypeptidase Q